METNLCLSEHRLAAVGGREGNLANGFREGVGKAAGGSYEATAGGQTCDSLNYLSGGIVRNLQAHEDSDEEWQKLLSMQSDHNKHDISHDKEHNPFLSCSVKSGVDSEVCKLGGLIN